MERPEALSPAEVIRLLRNKVARNPGDFDAGLMLGSALYKAGDPAASAVALKAALRLQPSHYQGLMLLARAEARSGQLPAAQETLARAQRAEPADPQAWQVAAALAVDNRNWEQLLEIASGWTMSHGDSTEAWQALSRAHFEQSHFQEAIAAFQRVLQLAPGNVSHLVGAARLAIAGQHYELAQQYLTTAQQVQPGSAELLYTQGRLQHMTGELEAAEASYRQAIKKNPAFANAFVELGTLKEGRLDDSELATVRQLFRDPSVHPEYRVMLGFTLGDALDRRKDTVQAFTAWEEANRINRSISEQEGFVYQSEQVEREPELLSGIFSEPFDVDTLNITGHIDKAGQPRPIFVVGMPRSGTTLVESILASHSDVYGAGELPALYDIYEELLAEARGNGLEAARAMVRREAMAWRKRYLDALPSISNRHSVVDKQPLNYRAIGLIRLLFPDSPVIYTCRSSMDVGLSIYRHKFSKNWPCAHSLSDIGHYYGVHARIIDLWIDRYPDSIYRLSHSRLVKDPESEIRRLLAHVKLSEQADCFQPHQTKRPIATFSSVQVRQPVSAAFAGKAQRYASQLAPLRTALNRAGVDIDGGESEQA